MKDCPMDFELAIVEHHATRLQWAPFGDTPPVVFPMIGSSMKEKAELWAERFLTISAVIDRMRGKLTAS
jgi:hypothetical protein